MGFEGSTLYARRNASSAVKRLEIPLFCLALTAAVPAIAADAPSSATAGSANVSAASPEQRSFNIPGGSLSNALTAFAQQSGYQITYDAALASGRTSPGLVGSYSSQQALAHILAGTRITYRFASGRTIALDAAPATSGGINLPPVSVQAESESPVGPGLGYVAHQSTAGTKTDTPILETPQTINVVTRQQMDDQQVVTVGQALNYTPGVISQAKGTIGDAGDAIFLRGFGGYGNEYLDGLRVFSGLQTPQFDPYGLERIEVLKGPASVLYGQNDPGGTVNLVSKMPTANPLHEVFLETGSYGLAEGGFDLGGPIDNDGHFLYRLTGLGLSTDTQTDFVKNQRLFIAPAFTWKPDADTTITLLTSYQRDPVYGLGAAVPAQGSVVFNPNGSFPSHFYDGDPTYNNSSDSRYSVGYLAEHRFDDTFTVRQNFRYFHSELNQGYVINSGFEPDLVTLDRFAFADHDVLNGITLDNQLQANVATGPVRHTILFGLDYQHSWNRDQQFFGSAPSLNAFNPVYGQTIPTPTISIGNSVQQLDQVGFYFQDQMKLDKWRLLLGGREDWASSRTQDLDAGTTTPQFNRAFTGRAGLIYLFDSGLAPYVSYSTSFQPTAGTDFSGAPFNPTTGQQEEIGVKYQPPGFNSFITVSAFNLTQQNVLTQDPIHLTFSTQTGEVRSRGIEIEGKANLTNSLDLIASYTYLDAVNTKSNTTGTTLGGASEPILGKRPVAIPTNSASTWANYTIHEGVADGLGFGGGVRYIGQTYGDNVNSITVPSYVLFDAALHYDLGHANETLRGLNLQVNATNLFDKKYYASCNNSSTCYIGLRRAVYATLRYNW